MGIISSKTALVFAAVIVFYFFITRRWSTVDCKVLDVAKAWRTVKYDGFALAFILIVWRAVETQNLWAAFAVVALNFGVCVYVLSKVKTELQKTLKELPKSWWLRHSGWIFAAVIPSFWWVAILCQVKTPLWGS